MKEKDMTPKTKKLTKSQSALLDSVVNDAETEFKAIVNAVQMGFNKMLMPRVDMHVEIFKEELGVPDEWVFDENTRIFSEPKKA